MCGASAARNYRDRTRLPTKAQGALASPSPTPLRRVCLFLCLRCRHGCENGLLQCGLRRRHASSFNDLARLIHRARMIRLQCSPNQPTQQFYTKARRVAGEDFICRHAQHIFRSEEHTSELQSLMRISYAVFCLKNKTKTQPYVSCTRIKLDNNDKLL